LLIDDESLAFGIVIAIVRSPYNVVIKNQAIAPQNRQKDSFEAFMPKQGKKKPLAFAKWLIPPYGGCPKGCALLPVMCRSTCSLERPSSYTRHCVWRRPACGLSELHFVQLLTYESKYSLFRPEGGCPKASPIFQYEPH